jgi:spore germination cell wall hydrolase CwlJ-like protein
VFTAQIKLIMRSVVKTAMAAALSIAILAPVMGLVGASPVTANDVSDVSDPLVPQAVMTAALAEERAAPDNLYLPALPVRADTMAPSRGNAASASLAQLVAEHGVGETSSREQECLAGAVYFEAKSESLEGQLAVADVIINRARSGRFPASLCGVVFQPSQFSFVRSGGFPPIARSSQDWREAVGVSEVAMRDLKDSSIGNALFFHARYVSPGWRLQRVAAVGNHIFYR